jgi:hypothetical protein
MRHLLLIPILGLVAPLCAVASDDPQQIRVSELYKTPLEAGPLKFRITRLERSGVFGLGCGHITVEVENASANPENFYPQRLVLVNRDNLQLNVWAGRRGYYTTIPPHGPKIPASPLEIRITPGARVKESYSLSGKVRLPARLFYDDKLLAEIVE